MDEECPQIRLRFVFFRTYLCTIVTQGFLGLALGGIILYMEGSWTSVLLTVGIVTGGIPAATAAIISYAFQTGAGENGIYLKAPRHVTDPLHWVDHLTPWQEIDSIHPSRMGFSICAGRTRIGLPAPFCFSNWKEFEALLRKHRPEFFKD